MNQTTQTFFEGESPTLKRFKSSKFSVAAETIFIAE